MYKRFDSPTSSVDSNRVGPGAYFSGVHSRSNSKGVLISGTCNIVREERKPDPGAYFENGRSELNKTGFTFTYN